MGTWQIDQLDRRIRYAFDPKEVVLVVRCLEFGRLLVVEGPCLVTLGVGYGLPPADDTGIQEFLF